MLEIVKSLATYGPTSPDNQHASSNGGNRNLQNFSDLLLSIKNDTFPKEEGKVRLPSTLCQSVLSSEELIPAVYGNIEQVRDRENFWLCERATLTTRNDRAVAINNTILSRLPGQTIEYCSINRMVDQDEATTYPIEFLNSLSASYNTFAYHKIKNRSANYSIA